MAKPKYPIYYTAQPFFKKYTYKIALDLGDNYNDNPNFRAIKTQIKKMFGKLQQKDYKCAVHRKWTRQKIINGDKIRVLTVFTMFVYLNNEYYVKKLVKQFSSQVMFVTKPISDQHKTLLLEKKEKVLFRSKYFYNAYPHRIKFKWYWYQFNQDCASCYDYIIQNVLEFDQETKAKNYVLSTIFSRNNPKVVSQGYFKNAQDVALIKLTFDEIIESITHITLIKDVKKSKS